MEQTNPTVLAGAVDLLSGNKLQLVLISDNPRNVSESLFKKKVNHDNGKNLTGTREQTQTRTLSNGDKPLMRARKYPAASSNSTVSVSLTFCSSSSRVSTYDISIAKANWLSLSKRNKPSNERSGKDVLLVLDRTRPTPGEQSSSHQQTPRTFSEKRYSHLDNRRITFASLLSHQQVDWKTPLLNDLAQPLLSESLRVRDHLNCASAGAGTQAGAHRGRLHTHLLGWRRHACPRVPRRRHRVVVETEAT